MATPGPSTTPDFQLIAQHARFELGDILDQTDGAKDVVIQSELMSLLNHIANVKFLKRYMQTINRSISIGKLGFGEGCKNARGVQSFI